MTKKKLYLIWQKVHTGYDTYSDAVVCAESEEEARNTDLGDQEYTWAEPKDVKVKELGVANDNVKKELL